MKDSPESAENISVHASRVGGGPGILFIHGWNHSRRIWRPVVSYLHEDITAVTIDLPGFGESPPLASQQVSIPQYAFLTEEVIRQVSEILYQCDTSLKAIVADSLGAVLVLEALYGKEGAWGSSKKVSLWLPGAENSTVNGGLPSALEEIETILLSSCPSDGLSSFMAIFRNLGLIETGLSASEAIPEWISKGVVRTLSLSTVHRLENVNDVLVESVLDADPMTSENLFGELVDYSFGKKSNPDAELAVRVVRGEHDRVTRRDDSLRLADQLEGVYEEISDVGHTPMIEAPEKYAALVKDRLEGL